MLLPLYARHKTRHRQKGTQKATQERDRRQLLPLYARHRTTQHRIIGKRSRTATRGQLEERKKEKDSEIFDIDCFVEDVLLSFCVDQDGPGVGLACLDQCKTGGNNREDEVEK